MVFTDICLFADNVLELISFYEKVFEVEGEKDEIHSALSIKGLTITFYNKSHAESIMGFNFSDSGSGMTYIGFNVDDVDREYDRLKRLGLDTLSQPTLWPWGAKSFNFLDIEGNRIVFRSWPAD